MGPLYPLREAHARAAQAGAARAILLPPSGMNDRAQSKTNVIRRRVMRAILLTPERQVLLMKIRVDGGRHIWVPPGGGLEAGETPAACLRRELEEEVGRAELVIGPPVWERQHTFNYNGLRYSYLEDYFLVETQRFVPVMRDAEEARILAEFRWWSLDELADAAEPLTPTGLHSIVVDYLAHGAPRLHAREVVVD